MNIYRTGIILKEIKNIPYILIIAGTDANVYIKSKIKDVIKLPLN